MPTWPDDDAMASHHDVVPDLDQIINFGAFADNGVLKSPAVDGRVGADVDVVLDDDAAHLRHLEMPLRAHGKAEAVLADAGPGVEDDAVADEGVHDGRSGPMVACPRPIATRYPMTAPAAMRVPRPMRASGPMIAPGSISAPSSITAEGSMDARRPPSPSCWVHRVRIEQSQALGERAIGLSCCTSATVPAGTRSANFGVIEAGPGGRRQAARGRYSLVVEEE